ncbi:cell wall protein [Nocardiopsis akebiae]|uniref:Cell wall protein n=1 Tax=Nocardiopsis akebiae TaxID=2831968 RepID=A0ABX8C1L5_9ACTN|nr:cell wall protein [Nocardiopsis akebiae]QUX28269.1 cell wall protein [Nocardiopsis akebiae]
MQAALSLRPRNGRRRGLVPPLAVTAALVLSAPTAALAQPVPGPYPDQGPVRPRVTTVDRTRGLDPGGDTVTVSGIGHEPGSLLEAATWAVPEAEGEPVADTANAVTVEVGERGTFSLSLDTGTGFAAHAGPDASDAPFEVRLVETGTGPEDEGPAGGAPPVPGPDAGTEPSGEDSDPAETTGATDAAPVTPPSAPAPDAVVGRVPVAFSGPAPRTEPRTGPQSRPQAAAPAAPVAREPGDPALSVSKTSGLDPEGETVTVTGSGYDTAKGIYVALCDTSGAGPDQAPGPCIGGVDTEGSSGASVWVSSNPPPYGEGLAVPYTGGGADGGFSVELRVGAGDENTDCADPGTECAVVTRNDHTRPSDRSQDVFVPVSFGGGSGNGGGSDGSGDSGGSGGSGDTGSGGGSGGNGDAATGGGPGSASGPLPRTGGALYGLVLAAAVAVLTGGAALVATRRRAREATADTA